METQLIGFLLDYCKAVAPASEGDSAVGFWHNSSTRKQKGDMGARSSNINF